MTGGKVTEEGERRLDAMVRTNDGFQIAELDLELRGPGEFFGTRQAGMPSFRVANLIRDRQLLELAKREAAAVMAGLTLKSRRQKSAEPWSRCARAGSIPTVWWKWAELVESSRWLVFLN
jgi:ATP-dependent DNA helicase RecG